MTKTIQQIILLLLAAVFTVSGAQANDTADAAAFLSLEADYDRYFAEALDELRIPGVTLAVVQGGLPVLLRGYGHARLDPPEPACPHTTLFRIGSATKLITVTAAMQCVERGLLSLHQDVNTWLTELQVPDDGYGQPIHLWHLLTHTPGFDDRFLELGVRNGSALEPLGAYLARRLPRRVSPPGEVFNYSNFGVTLAAHLVEAATGQHFIAFVEENLFQPLGMHPGGFDQPLTDEMHARLAHTYRWDGARYRDSQWRDAASQVYPAGAYATTAADMANFMIAHLQLGRFGDGQILQEETTRLMRAPHFSAHPALRQQQALGFHLRKHGGQQLVWHTGRVDMFTAQLVLVPALDVGLFVACNADSGDQTRNDVVDILARHLFPEPPPPEPASHVPLPAKRLQRYTGAYRQVRHVRDSFEKLGFLGQEIYFHRGGEGGLVESRFMSKQAPTRWQAVAGHDADVFAAANSAEPRRLVFVENADGTVQYACMDRELYTVLNTFERLRWYEHAPFQLFLVATCLLLLVSAPARRMVLLTNRLRGGGIVQDTSWGHVADGLAVLTGALLVAFVVGVAAVLTITDMYLFAFGVPLRMQALLLLPRLAVLTALALTLILLFKCRPNAKQYPLRYAHHTAVCVAAWLFIWVLHYWKLL